MDNNHFVIKVINKITANLSVYSSRFNTFSTIRKTNTTKKQTNKQTKKQQQAAQQEERPFYDC